MSNLRHVFENGKAFIPFITCGDPDLDTTGRAIRAAADNGADMIELGIPFSDPTAEGPVIQGANLRALQGGITTDHILEFVRELRRDVRIPLVFMTYANVVFSYGAERFLAGCQAAEISGLILPDLPFEEKEEFLPICRRYGVDLISYIAPATESRIAQIAREAEGFLYITPGASMGLNPRIKADTASILSVVRRCTDLPCAVGMEQPAAGTVSLSDGAIGGSGIVKLLERYGTEAPAYIGDYVRRAKLALSA